MSQLHWLELPNPLSHAVSYKCLLYQYKICISKLIGTYFIIFRVQYVTIRIDYESIRTGQFVLEDRWHIVAQWSNAVLCLAEGAVWMVVWYRLQTPTEINYFIFKLTWERALLKLKLKLNQKKELHVPNCHKYPRTLLIFHNVTYIPLSVPKTPTGCSNKHVKNRHD
jgi:hypothetical protein